MSAGDDKTMIFWDTKNGKKLITLEQTGQYNSLALLPNGLLVGSVSSAIKMWKLTYEGEFKVEEVDYSYANGTSSEIIYPLPGGHFATFSNVVAGAINHGINIWDANTFKIVKGLRGNERLKYTSLVYLPFGVLAGASEDKTIRLWDAETFELSKTLKWSTNSRNIIPRLATSPNGDLLAAIEYELKTWPMCEYTSEVPTGFISNQYNYLAEHPVMLLARNVLRVEQVPAFFPKTLEELDVSHTYINDELLEEILATCPKLKTIKYDGCGWLTEKGITLIKERQAQASQHTSTSPAGSSGTKSLSEEQGTALAAAVSMSSITALAAQVQQTVSSEDFAKTLRNHVEAVGTALATQSVDNQMYLQSLREEMQRLQQENAKQRAQQSTEIVALRLQVEQASGTDTTSLDTRLTLLEASQKLLMEEYNAQRANMAQIEHIMGQQELAQFYRMTQNKLQQVFLGYKLIDSGMVVRNDITNIDKVDKIITLAGEAVPLPGSRAVASLLKAGVWIANRKNIQRSDEKIDDISDIAVSFKELDTMTETIARLLTLAYEEQLLQLQPKSASILGEAAVKIMVAYLWSEEFQGTTNIVEQLVGSVARVYPQNLAEGFFQKAIHKIKEIKVKFDDTNLATTMPGLAWTAYGVLQRTGIKAGSPEQYFSGSTTKPEIYGYRQGTLEEAQAAGLTQTQERVPSQVLSAHSLAKSDKAQIAIVSQQTQTFQKQMEVTAQQLNVEHARRIQLEEQVATISAQVKNFTVGTATVTQNISNTIFITDTTISVNRSKIAQDKKTEIDAILESHMDNATGVKRHPETTKIIEITLANATFVDLLKDDLVAALNLTAAV